MRPARSLATLRVRYRKLRRTGRIPGWLLPALGFGVAGVALFAVVGVADARRSVSLARSALETAQVAVSSRDVPAAEEALDSAERHLKAAGSKAGSLPLTFVGRVPLVGSPVKAISAGSRAGREAVAAGRILAAAADALPTSGKAKLDGHDLSALHTASTGSYDALARAEEHLARARAELAGPAGAILPPVSSPAKALLAYLDDATDELDTAERAMTLLSQLSAPDTDVRLLLLAQDTMETRPTGGYIGSFGVLRVAHGTIELERYASFEDLPFPEPPMEAPPELAEVLIKPWNLSNANWWADFPTSARTAQEMFRRQAGGEVDGVLAITEDVMARLVGVLGSVTVPGYDKPVTEEGFAQRVLYEVELKRPLDTPRKRFLTLMADVVFDQLFALPAERVPAIADALGRSAGLGSIQVWFANPGWQAAVVGSSLDGSLPATEPAEDFLYLTEANMSAGKANAELTRTIDYQVAENADGRLQATLRVAYRNAGPASPINPYYNGLVSVHVPQGTELLNNQGALEGDPATPHARIVDRVLVDPDGGEAVLTFEYLLPETVAAGGRYHLTWLRQPGTPRDTLTASVGNQTFDVPGDQRRFTVDTDLKAPERGFARLLPG